MRPAAALVYLASVARVAAIQYGFPSVKSETSSFIDVNPVSVAVCRRQPGTIREKTEVRKPDF